MKLGTYISGGVHVGLIGWLLIGDVFRGEAPEPEVTDVSVISATEFDAMFASSAAPEIEVDLAQMPAPPTEDELEELIKLSQDIAPNLTEVSDPELPQEQESMPDVVGLQLLPDAEVSLEVPTMAMPSFDAGPDIQIDNSPDSNPREAPRIAPIPVIRPQQDAAVSDTVTEAAAEAEAPEVVEVDEQDAAPEEATTEIVTEAEKPAGAPTSVPVPRLRPQPTQDFAAPEPAPEPPKPDADALAAALAEAQDAPEPAATSQPVQTGPKLSSNEISDLIRQVGSCWSVGATSTASLSVMIDVYVEMDTNSKPKADSIKLVSEHPDNSISAENAFVVARRAIIRCGLKPGGYNLPVDKYERWKTIVMTFNPEKMRNK